MPGLAWAPACLGGRRAGILAGHENASWWSSRARHRGRASELALRSRGVTGIAVKVQRGGLGLAYLAALLAAVLVASCSEQEAGAPGAAPAPPRDQSEVRPLPQAQSERKLVYSADVLMRGGDPWALAEEARRVPGEFGGDLLSMEQFGEGDSRSARLAMRIPATRFEQALERLRGLDAEVVSSRVDTKDVTEEFVDLEARVTSKKREEEQYLSLLSQARSVDDTLKVSQALGDVRTEIERLTGQLNSLKGRVDYSTITVTIDNVADLSSQSAWQPARTAVEALVALVSLLKFLGDLAIWLVIVGWVPALLVFGFIRLRSLYRQRFPPQSPPPPTTAASPPQVPDAAA